MKKKTGTSRPIVPVSLLLEAMVFNLKKEEEKQCGNRQCQKRECYIYIYIY